MNDGNRMLKLNGTQRRVGGSKRDGYERERERDNKRKTIEKGHMHSPTFNQNPPHDPSHRVLLRR